MVYGVHMTALLLLSTLLQMLLFCPFWVYQQINCQSIQEVQDMVDICITILVEWGQLLNFYKNLGVPAGQL
jgi:hypothetical protein